MNKFLLLSLLILSLQTSFAHADSYIEPVTGNAFPSGYQFDATQFSRYHVHIEGTMQDANYMGVVDVDFLVSKNDEPQLTAGVRDITYSEVSYKVSNLFFNNVYSNSLRYCEHPDTTCVTASGTAQVGSGGYMWAHPHPVRGRAPHKESSAMSFASSADQYSQFNFHFRCPNDVCLVDTKTPIVLTADGDFQSITAEVDFLPWATSSYQIKWLLSNPF
jgi:hypothetical protein